MSRKLIISVSVTALLAVALFLLTVRPVQAYSLTYKYLEGENFVYNLRTETQTPLGSTRTSASSSMSILKVENSQTTFRSKSTMTIFEVAEFTSVSTIVITDKGKILSVEVEHGVPGLEKGYESFLQTPTYPEAPVPMGGGWTTPINYSLPYVAGSITTSGDVRYKLAGSESVTTKAGRFECFVIELSGNINVNMLGPAEAAQSMNVQLEGALWIHENRGFVVKGTLRTTGQIQILEQTVQVSSNLSVELVEHFSRITP